jgi:SAM-dependent methyltransferase
MSQPKGRALAALYLGPMSFAAGLVQRLPAFAIGPARWVADVAIPRRRQLGAQWRRINLAMAAANDVVQGGPFAGMRLGAASTGSHVPKRLGSYEEELHAWVEYFIKERYEKIVDVGCGEGYYVVGLARRMPETAVTGHDISVLAQSQCRAAAELNDVADRVVVAGLCSPAALADATQQDLLVIIDAEGAEVDLLRGTHITSLRHVDLLIELHDFLVPGATTAVSALLEPSHDLHLVDVSVRSSADHPLLQQLAPADRLRALDESRPKEQQWLVALSRTRRRFATPAPGEASSQ